MENLFRFGFKILGVSEIVYLNRSELLSNDFSLEDVEFFHLGFQKSVDSNDQIKRPIENKAISSI